jgi:hypothetical protein
MITVSSRDNPKVGEDKRIERKIYNLNSKNNFCAYNSRNNG